MKKNLHIIWILLVLCSGQVIKDSITSMNSQTFTEEGQKVTLSCSYTTTYSSVYYLFWYRHYPGSAPQFILYKANKGSSSNSASFAGKRFTSEVTINSTELVISDVKTEDSATYLCALQAESGFTKLTFGKGTKLQVHPKTDRTKPSVYQLTTEKPKESLPNTVCLLTDFPSPNITLDADEQAIELIDKAALDKSSSDVWRYSAVIWDWNNPSKDLSCAVKYGEETVLPDMKKDETTDTCSSLSVTERFHTNPSMNTLSTSVLGLRILTAKAIVFNLIITLRLWSS